MAEPPKKLSFGFKAKVAPRASVKVNLDEDQEQRDLVTSVEGAKIKTASGTKTDVDGKRKLVVPKLENTYQAGRKFAPSFVPTLEAPEEDTGEKFVLAGPQEVRVTQFGLDTRASKGAAAERTDKENKKEKEMYDNVVNSLPDEATLDDYEAMPVEEFGMALLRGMGWEEGQGLGRKKRVVENKEVKRRPDRLGLGAQPAPLPSASKREESKSSREHQRSSRSEEDGQLDKRQRREDSQKTSRGEEELVGREVRIRSGREQGQDGKVKRYLPVEDGQSERVEVLLKSTGRVVSVRCRDLQVLGERHHGESGSNGRESDQVVNGLHSRSPADGRSRDKVEGEQGTKARGKADSSRVKHRESDRHPSNSTPSGSAPSGWLAPNIRVRIVDRRISGGRCYLKKGVVMDVAPGACCDICLDDGGEVIQAFESSLETVVPRQEGTVLLVVRGQHRGEKAKLLQCHTSEGVAAVQLLSDYTVQRVLLDDVAQYVGRYDDD